MKNWCTCWFLVICSFHVLIAQDMNNEKLGDILKVTGDTLMGSPGRWEVWIGEVPMLCLTDESHNRMRIISLVKDLAESSREEILNCMEANFHTALDVKYAISDEVIWVAFIHPLKELSRGQVVDALAQVRAAVLTFGTTYSSTDLSFPKQDRLEPEQKKKKDKDRT